MRSMSIVGTSAILPSPNRIRKMADNKSYVNYTHLHAQTIPMPEPSYPPIPKGKQAQPLFWGGAQREYAYPWPHFRGADWSPLGAGRVSVVDLGEVGRDRLQSCVCSEANWPQVRWRDDSLLDRTG